jgi:hypothetical protein
MVTYLDHAMHVNGVYAACADGLSGAGMRYYLTSGRMHEYHIWKVLPVGHWPNCVDVVALVLKYAVIFAGSCKQMSNRSCFVLSYSVALFNEHHAHLMGFVRSGTSERGAAR